MKALFVILCVVSFSFGNEIDTLTNLFEKCGKTFGSVIDPWLVRHDTAYIDMAKKLNGATIKIFSHLMFISSDSIDFSDADTCYNFCIRNNIEHIRGHSLVYKCPSWMNTLSRNDFICYTKYFIQETINRYPLIKSWDVVNHPFKTPNTDDSLNNTITRQIIGNSYIDSAFIWAYNTDPTKNYFLNENFHHLKIQAYVDWLNTTYMFVKRLVNNDIPITGVGCQMRSYGDNNMINVVGYKAFIDSITNLGLKIHFTEVESPVDTPFIDVGYDIQAVKYGQVVNLCLSYDAIKVFNVWGFTDKYTWLSDPYGNASILDTTFNPKIAYYEMKKVLQKEVTRIELENTIDTLENMLDECDMDTLIVECEEKQDLIDILIDILETIGVNVTKILNKWRG